MHLSHLREDLEAWYRLSFAKRGEKAFEPGPAPNVPEDTLTFAPADRILGPADVAHNVATYRTFRPIGPAASRALPLAELLQ